MMTPAPPVRVELTREQLYTQAWKEPLSKLASRYGISNVALRKICLKHDIPIPPRGHWAKVRAGGKVAKPRLPKGRNDRPIWIVRTPKQENRPDVSEAIREVAKREAEPRQEIRVKKHPKNLHPVAVEVRRKLRASRSNHYGQRECVRDSLFYVRVSEGNINRAVLIVDALVRAALKRDCVLRAPVEHTSYSHRKQAALVVEGEPLTFYLSEKQRRVEHVPTADEIARQKQYLWDRPKKYDHIPTGLFQLDLRKFGNSSAMRSWRDKKLKSVEDQLNDVMVALFELAEKRREERVQYVAAQVARREEEERRAELRRQRELEAARVQELHHQADGWAKAQQLRALVAAARVEADRSAGTLDREGFERWVAWASARADAVDPLDELLARFRLMPGGLENGGE